MTKLFLIVFMSVLGLAYGQMSGVLPISTSEAEADWIGLVLILCFFLFLFTIHKQSHCVNDDINHSRQRDEVQREFSEK